MSNKSDDITMVEVNTFLLKAALRVAAKKLVTGAVAQKMPDADANVVFGAGKILTSDDAVAEIPTYASVTINGDSAKDLRQGPLLRLAERARARLNKNKKEDDVATLFKNAYLKSKE